MPRYNSAGLYTIETRRLGMLPVPPRQVGVSPTGPITIQQPAPSSLPGGTGVSADTVRVLMQAYDAGGRLAADSNRADLVGPTRTIRVWLEALLLHPLSDGTIPAANVRTILMWPADQQQRSDILFFIHAAMPTVNPQDVIARIDTSTSVSASEPIPQTQVPNFRANISFTSNGGISAQQSPAANVIAQGGSGASASTAQTQAVLEATDTTSIVPATGPTMSLPGYAPIGVTDGGVPLDPMTGQPYSGPHALLQWWKPALAVALGAALGVGIGRAVAG